MFPKMGVNGVSSPILSLVWGGNVHRRIEKPRRDHKLILSPSPVLWVLAWAGEHRKQDCLGIDHLFLLFVSRGKEISDTMLAREAVSGSGLFGDQTLILFPPHDLQLAGWQWQGLRLKDVDNGCFHPMSRFGAKTAKKEFSFNSHFPQTSQQ